MHAGISPLSWLIDTAFYHYTFVKTMTNNITCNPIAAADCERHLLPDNHAEDLDHVQVLLVLVPSRLRFDTRHLKGVIPAGQDSCTQTLRRSKSRLRLRNLT